MDTTKDFQNLSIDDRKLIYNKYFDSGGFTDNTVQNKLRLIDCLCFLTFQIKKHSELADQYKSTKDVIEKFIENRTLDDANIFDRYLIGLSIICDNILEGIHEYNNTTGCKNTGELKLTIINLLSQWIPF